jgi:hypothetical protein
MSNLTGPKLKIRPVFRPPIEADGTLQNTANVVGLRNDGTAKVNLANGAWSLAPGESLFLGSQTDWNVILIENIVVTFDTTTGSEKKLQILELLINAC